MLQGEIGGGGTGGFPGVQGPQVQQKPLKALNYVECGQNQDFPVACTEGKCRT